MNRTSWLLAFWCSLVLPVWARVGGGESYSGGGSSYSSGSSGGGGGGDGIGLIIELIIRLIFYYPKIGIPLVVGIAVWWWYHSFKGSKDAAFQDLQKWSANNTVKKHTRPDLTRLTAKDPNFSETLFLDFLTSLYTRALRGRRRCIHSRAARGWGKRGRPGGLYEYANAWPVRVRRRGTNEHGDHWRLAHTGRTRRFTH